MNRKTQKKLAREKRVKKQMNEQREKYKKTIGSYYKYEPEIVEEKRKEIRTGFIPKDRLKYGKW